MDLARYLSLYLAETQEHLRALDAALLELERSGAGSAVEEAFRAVHTIKGMAATMGHAGVTETAHALEDRLSELRGGAPVDSALVDSLLRDADTLAQEVARSTASAQATVGGSLATVAAPAIAARPPSGAEVPADAAVVQVFLRPDTQLKAARAALVLRAAAQHATLLGSAPAAIDDDFDGALLLFVARGADRAALEAAIRAAGDVETVLFPTDGAEPAAVSASAPAVRHQHVRVDQRRLDELANGVGELGMMCAHLAALIGIDPATEHGDLLDRVTRLVGRLQESVLAARMVPVAEVFERFPRVVRDAARSLGKEVDFRIEGADIQLDRSILQEVADPLVHLLRNAVSHGLESPQERLAAGKPAAGRVVLRAARVRSSVEISVADDGGGVDAERVFARAAELGIAVPAHERGTAEGMLRVLSHPGFSTAEEVSDVSGRGVGLDAVVTRVRALGGAVDLRTEQGTGTTFILRLPLTLAVAHALRVRVGGEDYAIPLTHVAEAIELRSSMITSVRGREVVRLRGDVLPLVRLGQVLGAQHANDSAAVITEIGERRTALAVDELVGREQIVVKTFDAAVGALPIFSGATLLASGRPALVLDPASVA